MHSRFCKKLKQQMRIGRVGVLLGMVMTVLVIIARLGGSMQSLEWQAYDSFLCWRPAESIDERILIIGINEEDIPNLKAYPISDQEIAWLLNKLQTYSPQAIGLDMARDLPFEPGNSQLIKTVKNLKNLIGIEKILNEKVQPPAYLAPENIGFVDEIIDADGKLRRSLLAIPTDQGYKLSFALRLAKLYLSPEGISLEKSQTDPTTIRLGNTELLRFFSNTGAYVRSDASGIEVLLKFRSGRRRFRTITLGDIKTGKFKPEWIRDRIVIIGMTTLNAKNVVNTSAIPADQPLPGLIYHVELQAHHVSQIISAVLDSRPLIRTWSDEWEYIWITAWGFLGIASARLNKTFLGNLVDVSIASAFLVVICYLFLTWSCWVPVIPTVIIYALNGIGLSALYQYERDLRTGINNRQAIIERTFEMIHNGPLQNLANVLKRLNDQDLSTNKLLLEVQEELHKLNYELRGIYDFLQQEPSHQDSSIYLGNGQVINLHDPLHEILYQIYTYTLERDFPCFSSIKVKIPTFEPLENRYLTIEHKRGLCRFLEEALCNVGIHATGVTRLVVSCSSSPDWYTLSIIDDGVGIKSSREGRGTQQFKNLAQQFKGKFRRVSLSPRGTLCELSWPVTKGWFI